jgi:predicted Zn finger-like uncharacterized protein
MFTVCPKCALTLVVTATDLRTAQGYVRCGRCSSVFNALARLSERQGTDSAAAAAAVTAGSTAEPLATPQAGGTATASDPGAPQPPAQEPVPASGSALQSIPQERPIPDEALEFNAETTDVNSVFVQAPPNPQWTAATGSFRALVSSQERAPEPDSQVDIEIDAVFLASMLRDESADTPAQVAAPTVPASEARAAAAPRGAGTIPPEAARRARILKDAEAAAVSAAAGQPPETQAVPSRPLTEEEAIQEAEALAAADSLLPPEQSAPAAAPHPLARWLPYAWPAGCAFAVLLLLAQVLNHHRDELAASARFNHALSAVYGSLGIRLFPRWDLRAYDVRQLGASGDPAGNGVITVRASIKNGASQAQPLPLLRVTLQDRFGNRIAARDVAPQDYLPSAMPATSFLSAGQRIDAQMGFADPGPNAVGFEIDACLPAAAGVTACANDATAR